MQIRQIFSRLHSHIKPYNYSPLLVFTSLLVLALVISGCNMPSKIHPNSNVSSEALKATLDAEFVSVNIPTTPPLLSAATPTLPQQIPTDQKATATTQAPLALPELQTPAIFPTRWSDAQYIYYPARSGDTLSALAKRFNIEEEQITSEQPIPPKSFINPGQVLRIPNTYISKTSPNLMFPDSEIINSPSAVNFDIENFIRNAGGFLSVYQENVDGKLITGADIVKRVSAEVSVNPRILLAFLEYRSHWVLGDPKMNADLNYPIGMHVPGKRGLYEELAMTASKMSVGYYAWRAGDMNYLIFRDSEEARLNPEYNAGTVAAQYLFSKFYYKDTWQQALFGKDNFIDLYWQMFGDPWEPSRRILIFPSGITQPTLELPFSSGERWSLTGGPHYAWNSGSPWGALDFAPVTGEPECSVSKRWVTASAPGLIVRAANNVVVIDLDGDGYEQTGWSVLYLHIAQKGMIKAGTYVNVGDHIGHPSCERGRSTGTHVHITRKYNGEWLAADSPIPFVLSGWQAIADPKIYKGVLVKGNKVVVASPVGPQTSIITH